MMKEHVLTVKQLDQQLSGLNYAKGSQVPYQGWVRTLRKALGMTIKQLAKRLEVDPSRVVKIENAEVDDALTLRTLKSVAKAYDCTFVYGFVPKKNFEMMIRERAEKIANAQLQRIAHTMSLEAQSVDPDWLEQQKADLIDELLKGSWKHLWNDE